MARLSRSLPSSLRQRARVPRMIGGRPTPQPFQLSSRLSMPRGAVRQSRAVSSRRSRRSGSSRRSTAFRSRAAPTARVRRRRARYVMSAIRQAPSGSSCSATPTHGCGCRQLPRWRGATGGMSFRSYGSGARRTSGSRTSDPTLAEDGSGGRYARSANFIRLSLFSAEASRSCHLRLETPRWRE